jgi:hypothetical protein
MSLAYKYTDTDVRSNPDLVGQAYEFLQSYQGEFEFLRDAKHDLEDQGMLPTGIVRGVLNCMRTQPVVFQRLSQPIRPVSIIHPERVRRGQVPLKTVWHKRYFSSLWPRAYKAHLLDHTRSSLIWLPYINEIHCHPYILCSARLRMGVMTNDTMDREVCTRCLAQEVERSYVASA